MPVGVGKSIHKRHVFKRPLTNEGDDIKASVCRRSETDTEVYVAFPRTLTIYRNWEDQTFTGRAATKSLWGLMRMPDNVKHLV